MDIKNDYQNAGLGQGFTGGFGGGGAAYGAYGDPVTGALAALTHANSTDLIRDVADSKLAIANTSADLIDGTTGVGTYLSNQLREVEREVVIAKSELKDLIVGSERHLNAEFRNLDNRLCDFEKDSVRNFYENKVKMLEVECNLSKQILDSRYLTDKQIVASEIALGKEISIGKFQTEKQIDMLSRQLEECCCDLKQMNIQSKLENTQDELNELRIKASQEATIAALRGHGHYYGHGNGNGNGNGNGKG